MTTSVKHSSRGISSGLLKALQKLSNNKSGSISYVFVDSRVENIHSEKIVEKKVQSILHNQISEAAIEGKTLQQLLEMFQTTKNDLGASHFIID